MKFFAFCRVTNLAAAIIAVEAVLVMIGWVFGIEPLTRIAPVGRDMQFITAFLFLLSAIGLFSIARVVKEGDEIARLILPGISLTTFLLTVTLLVGRILGTPTGIEDLFLQQLSPISSIGLIRTAGWPSYPTMLNFILFGLAGITSLFPGSIRERVFNYFGTGILAIGAIAVTGYLLNIPILYYDLNSSTVPMAFNCAVLFVLLGFGLLRVCKMPMS